MPCKSKSIKGIVYPGIVDEINPYQRRIVDFDSRNHSPWRPLAPSFAITDNRWRRKTEKTTLNSQNAPEKWWLEDNLIFLGDDMCFFQVLKFVFYRWHQTSLPTDRSRWRDASFHIHMTSTCSLGFHIHQRQTFQSTCIHFRPPTVSWNWITFLSWGTQGQPPTMGPPPNATLYSSGWQYLRSTEPPVAAKRPLLPSLLKPEERGCQGRLSRGRWQYDDSTPSTSDSWRTSRLTAIFFQVLKFVFLVGRTC